MKQPLPSKDKRFLIALAVSLAFHLALLLIKSSAPPDAAGSASKHIPSRLDVRLEQPSRPNRVAAPPALPQPEIIPKRAAVKPRRQTAELKPVPVVSAEAQKNWTKTEKGEMSRFLSDLNSEAKPPAGQALQQKALAMARAIGAQGDRDDEAAEIAQRLRAAKIEPLNIELYYEALFRKLNSSAAMVKNKSQESGSRVAVVRVVLNPNGSVRSFTTQQAADQQSEIAYIQSVVERAAPFPAFPEAIRNATDKMILTICIQPRGYGPEGGAFFSRMSRGQSCSG